MAAPGKIFAKNAFQRILDSSAQAPRLYRICNDGPGDMGVTYTSADGERSAVILPGRTLDIYAFDIEIRHDSGDHVAGTYEAL